MKTPMYRVRADFALNPKIERVHCDSVTARFVVIAGKRYRRKTDTFCYFDTREQAYTYLYGKVHFKITQCEWKLMKFKEWKKRLLKIETVRDR